MLVVASDGAGNPLVILPLGIRHRAGLTIASFLGDRHANLNLGVFDRTAMERLGRSEMESVLRQAATMRGVDLYMLRSQPLQYQGIDNPMMHMPRVGCASSCWGTPLEGDGETMIRQLRSSESLKKLRAKARKLGEIGPIAYVEAHDPATIETILNAFYAQKSGQFDKLGIADPYACPAVRQFLLDGLKETGGRSAPIGLWALRVGDAVAAVFAAATHAGRRSGMFISYDADPAIAKNSPGELLLQHVIKASCDSDLKSFDLGTGDGPYKKDYCPVQKPLFDSILPMTIKGCAPALVVSSALVAKSAAKKSALAVWSVDRIRKARAALRRA